MKPEALDAFYAWLAGLGIGGLPLLVHAVAHYFIKLDGPETSWTVDLIFVTISTAGASAVSLLGRPGSTLILRGKAAPALVFILVAFLVVAAVMYGAEVTGRAQDYAVYLGWGLLIGAAALSLYFELTIAGRLARAATAQSGV